MNFNKMRKDFVHHRVEPIKLHSHSTSPKREIDIKNPSKSETKTVYPYFQDLEEKLIELIKSASYVIGCAAWLTNDNILMTLAGKSGVKIIVNKEEYLRADTQSGKRLFYQGLRNKYNNLDDMFKSDCPMCDLPLISCKHFVKMFKHIKTEDLIAKDGAVLSCGIVNNFSKMHHKFILFFDENFEPKGVWTGSYNLSNNSNMCLENALYITDPDVFEEYLLEFQIIYSYSEPYKWDSGLLSKPIKGSHPKK